MFNTYLKLQLTKSSTNTELWRVTGPRCLHKGKCCFGMQLVEHLEKDQCDTNLYKLQHRL